MDGGLSGPLFGITCGSRTTLYTGLRLSYRRDDDDDEDDDKEEEVEEEEESGMLIILS